MGSNLGKLSCLQIDITEAQQRKNYKVESSLNLEDDSAVLLAEFLNGQQAGKAYLLVG